ncbi:MAG: hypothetical protein ACR2HR_14420 [Euzebya sp.]
MSSPMEPQPTPNPAQPAYDNTTVTAKNEGRVFSIIGIVLAFLALAFVPIIIGPIGAVLGYVGHRKGDPWGMKVMIGAIVATVVGMIIGAIVVTQVVNY